jgi:hypothetical protein
MKSQHQQFHMDQTQQTFDLSKQVMVLDERILEVQTAITNTQEEYKVHRKNIIGQEEKIKEIQEQIMNCQVQIEILKGKPGEDGGVEQSIGKISLMEGMDDFIPTAQNSPRWEATGGEEEISRLGHQVDLTSAVRHSRPSELLDLASCHLESLLPQTDVDRIQKLLSPAQHKSKIYYVAEEAVQKDEGAESSSRSPSRRPSKGSDEKRESRVQRETAGHQDSAASLGAN